MNPRQMQKNINSKTYSNDNARNTNIRTQPLTDARTLPEDTKYAVFARVHHPRRPCVYVGRCADDEEEDYQEGVEVEEGGLDGISLVC